MLAVLYLILGVSLVLFHLCILTISVYLLEASILIEFFFMGLSMVDFSFFFILDKYSLCFLSFIIMISGCVMFYSFIYMDGDLSAIRFITLVFLFVCSMGILVISPNLLGVMLGWDGLGVISFLLVIYYQNYSSIRSGLVTIYTNRLGDVGILFSIFLMHKYGSLLVDSFYGVKFLFFFSLMLLLGGMTKSAQLPFSSWLPAAMSAPTPVSSLVHSSTLVTAGVYLFIRFFYMMEYYFLNLLFSWVSLITSFMAGLMAYYESDLKKMVAMSTLSQLGLMMFILSFGEINLCYFHMVTHALFKSLLFLSCGAIILMSLGGQDMRYMGSFSYLSSVMVLMVMSSNLSLIGFSFLSGFYSKDLILEIFMSFHSFIFLMLILFLSCILSFMYSVKMMFFGINSIRMSNSSITSVSKLMMVLPMGLILFWAISLGKFMSLLILFGEIPLLSAFNKSLGTLVLLFGLIIWIFMNYMKMNYSFYLNYMFFMEMGFLNWFFGGGSSSIIKKSLFSTHSDFTWMEIFSNKGIFILMSNLSIIFYVKFLVKSSVVLALLFCIFTFI